MLYFSHTYTNGGITSLMAKKINKTSQGFTRLKFQKNFGGFTIIELMIASTAFSLALIVAVGGFIGIGQLFFKGLSNTQAQQVARQTIDDIAGNIRRASTISSLQPTTPSPGGYYYLYYCIGGIRYTFGHTAGDIPIPYVGGTVDPNLAHPNFGLLRDKLPGSGACAEPCSASCQPWQVSLSGAQELLANNMRVGDLRICANNTVCSAPPAVNNFYFVKLDIAYGDTSTMSFNTADHQHVIISCAGHISVQSFCGVNSLSTGVYNGIHP
jgi:type II secretory pathway pseudopilin PulG